MNGVVQETRDVELRGSAEDLEARLRAAAAADGGARLRVDAREGALSLRPVGPPGSGRFNATIHTREEDGRLMVRVEIERERSFEFDGILLGQISLLTLPVLYVGAWLPAFLLLVFPILALGLFKSHVRHEPLGAEKIRRILNEEVFTRALGPGEGYRSGR